MNSIQTCLENAHETLRAISDSARLDSEILLCHVLEKNRAYLRTWPEKKLTFEELNIYQNLVEKRNNGIPIAYILGIKEFWSKDFIVNQHVLIPRPETELLIELALDFIPNNKPYSILDLGTGSGAIGLTIAAERPKASITLTDTSRQALEIAKLNAKKHNLSNIQFQISNWFRNLSSQQYNLVLSNPPYIDPADPHLQQGDVRFEPKTALIANHNGLEDILEIAKTARNHILPKGYLVLEHGYNQKQQVHSIFKKFNYTNIVNHPDLAGQPRITLGQWQT